ncbi:shieldin complex subunit 1-like [Heptranchias perlo]|uniref:shieldin complex subunit 1-like n=1 Tax=Heptranchias perlo TaxID=212740 RepID=UPI00355995FF
MSTNEDFSSNPSEWSSVLELPATYNLPDGGGQLMSDDDIAGGTSDSTVNTFSSVMPTVNTADSDHPNSEDGISTVEIAKLHPRNEDEHYGCQFNRKQHGNQGFFHTPSGCCTANIVAPSPTGSHERNGCTSIAQTMEDFFKDAGQRKLVESNPVSEQIAHLLTSKISQLKEERGGQYLLRSFQMALVLFNRHGAKIFQKGNFENLHFSSSVNSAVDSAEFNPMPGLSKDVVNFILQKISK